MFTTLVNNLSEAVFWAQAQFYIADNVKDVAISVEEKGVEIEVAIFVTKTGLNDVRGTDSVLDESERCALRCQ